MMSSSKGVNLNSFHSSRQQFSNESRPWRGSDTPYTSPRSLRFISSQNTKCPVLKTARKPRDRDYPTPTSSLTRFTISTPPKSARLLLPKPQPATWLVLTTLHVSPSTWQQSLTSTATFCVSSWPLTSTTPPTSSKKTQDFITTAST